MILESFNNEVKDIVEDIDTLNVVLDNISPCLL
jgi:hypothetical protein